MFVRTSILSISVFALLIASQTAEAQPEGRGRFPQASLESTALGLVGVEAVRAEIKLDEEQTKKIREIAEASRASTQFPSRESFDGLSEEERRAKMTEAFEKLAKAREDRNAKYKEVLSDEQEQRLKEIALQFWTRTGVEVVFAMPEFVEAAKVTNEQKEKVEALRSEMREEAQKQGDDRRAQFQWMRNEGAKKYAPKFEELLTAEQKEVLTKMKGAEFDVSKIEGAFGRRGQRSEN